MSTACHDPQWRGARHGRQYRSAIRTNVGEFREAARRGGWDLVELERVARDIYTHLPESERLELEAIGEAAGIAATPHRAYALTSHVVAPEECTVAAAVGVAGKSGATVLLKNSDKIGAEVFVGDGYHEHKEINVVVDFTTEYGTRVLGVAAAGTTLLKMGLNDAGVAVASNIARTTELRQRDRSLDELRALDRGRLLRQALDHATAKQAADWAIDTIGRTPMATPGNLHFAQADRMFIVEASFDRLAVEHVRDRVVARANGFILLGELNDERDDSSPARRARALEMLIPKVGSISAEDMREVSQDHANGPGPRSICRHSPDFHDETTLSSMIVSLHPDTLARSVAEFALGKPCSAWHSADSSLLIDVASERAAPGPFTQGAAWLAGYRETVV